jgi:hypothetical protein
MTPKFTLFNRISILIFSVLLTGFCGALMLTYNMRVIGKNNKVWPVIIFALIGNAFLRQVVKELLPGTGYELFIPNSIIGLILIFPVWNTFFTEISDFRAKPVWIPLTVFIILYGGLYYLNVLRNN